MAPERTVKALPEDVVRDRYMHHPSVSDFLFGVLGWCCVVFERVVHVWACVLFERCDWLSRLAFIGVSVFFVLMVCRLAVSTFGVYR